MQPMSAHPRLPANLRRSPARKRRGVDARGIPYQPEGDFLLAVVVFAHLYRWETHHEHDSRRSSAGWPDLEMVRPPRHVRAELKRDDEDVEPGSDQDRILAKLRECPSLEVYVWHPRDWPAIVQILTRR
jgi:hypothetical protein